MQRLIRLSPYPPGEFEYSQLGPDGKVVSWPASGLSIQGQAQVVLSFRQKNQMPRATLGETIDDINVYTCQRLNNNPRFCSETGMNGAVVIQVQTGKKGGGCCGAPIN